jgi:Skp family chaperone for outer membrane proteins
VVIVSLSKRIALIIVFLIVSGSALLSMIGPQLSLGGFGGRHTPLAIGFIDVQKVFEGSTRGKAQIASFQSELASRNTEVKQLNQRVETLKQEIQHLAAQGNRAGAERKIPQFQEAQKKLLEVQQQASQELQQTQADVDKAYISQLKPVLDQVRKEEHLDIIQAYDPKRDLSFEPSQDITQKVLIKYNQTYPEGEAATVNNNTKTSPARTGPTKPTSP